MGTPALLCLLSFVPSTASTPSDVITRVDNAEGWIAVTFDACATATQGYAFDWAIYRVLEQERVPATVFVSGHWVEAHPDAMKAMVANPLIEFGNHSYDHPHMPRLEVAQMREEVARTEAVLAPYDRRSVAFRPPFGELDARVVETVRQMGLPVVLWDVVSGDPSARITADEIVRVVARKTRPGSIVIFHINGRGARTAEALPTVLRRLREKGLAFVPLSQLLGLSDPDGPMPLSNQSPPEAPGGILCEPPESPRPPPGAAAGAATLAGSTAGAPSRPSGDAATTVRRAAEHAPDLDSVGVPAADTWSGEDGGEAAAGGSGGAQP